MKKNLAKRGGFTLIEILVVIGIIAILAGVVLIAINPARQFAQARDSQRVSNVEAYLNAIGQNMADNKGQFKCGGVVTAITTTTLGFLKSSATFPDLDIRNCVVPTYISEVSVDPAVGRPWDGSAYDTRYQIIQDATSSRITILAPSTEIASPTISITR